MIIRINGVPPSLNRFNGRQNTHEYRGLKDRWTRIAFWAAKEAGAGAVAAPDRAMVIITYHFPDRRRRDPDNYSGKFLLDGLTKAKAIVDDSFDHISLLHRQGAVSSKPFTEIEIYPQASVELRIWAHIEREDYSSGDNGDKHAESPS